MRRLLSVSGFLISARSADVCFSLGADLSATGKERERKNITLIRLRHSPLLSLVWRDALSLCAFFFFPEETGFHDDTVQAFHDYDVRECVALLADELKPQAAFFPNIRKKKHLRYFSTDFIYGITKDFMSLSHISEHARVCTCQPAWIYDA